MSGVGGYQRHHLSHEYYQQNFMASKFELTQTFNQQESALLVNLDK